MSHSKQLVQDVSIRSKYLYKSEERRLIISPRKEKIIISAAGNPNDFKEFHIGDVKGHRTQGNTITLSLNNGRKYEIEAKQPQTIIQALQETKHMQLTNQFVEQNVTVAPKMINYYQPFNPLKAVFNPLQNMAGNYKAGQPKFNGMFIELKPINPSKQNLSSLLSINSQQKHTTQVVSPILTSDTLPQTKKEVIKVRQYAEASFFIDPNNWKRQNKTGNLILINEQWKSNTSKIVGFVVKKFLTSGSFMGISFPTFAMKPQSILQTYAKSFGVAPKLFKGVKNHLQRMKSFVSMIFTISMLHVDIRKPFNPVIGQTFQAQIGGGLFSAEQISHHPPVSAFMFELDDYKIFGSLELSASIGLNSGEGRFIGDITAAFADGYWIKGRFPNGQIEGFVLGQTKFMSYGGSYAYDNERTVCTYELGNNYIYEGFIGLLNAKYSQKFREKLQDKDRFIKFSAYSRQKYERIYCSLQAKTCSYVSFDQQLYFDFDDHKNLPYEPQTIQNQGKLLLKSDSIFRLDIALRKEQDMERSQVEKQRIEEQERRYRKLREKFQK